MSKKITPVCSCPICWKPLEMLEQETFQMESLQNARPLALIKQFVLRCKDCAVEEWFEEGEEDDRFFNSRIGDRMFYARVELLQAPINWQPRQKIRNKKRKKKIETPKSEVTLRLNSK